MGQELAKGGETRLGKYTAKLNASREKGKGSTLSLSAGLVEFALGSKEVSLALSLVAETLRSFSYPEEYFQSVKEDRERDLMCLDGDRLDALLNIFDVRVFPLKFWQVLYSYSQQRRSDQRVNNRDTATSRDIRTRQDSNEPYRRDTSHPHTERDRDLGSSTLSKQFRKVDFQTYEMLSKELCQGLIIPEESLQSSSLGQDTAKNLQSLEWRPPGEEMRTAQPIGRTLKNLVTQNTQVSAINIGQHPGGQKKTSRSPLKQRDPSPEESFDDDAEWDFKAVVNSRAQFNQGQYQPYQPAKRPGPPELEIERSHRPQPQASGTTPTGGTNPITKSSYTQIYQSKKGLDPVAKPQDSRAKTQVQAQQQASISEQPGRGKENRQILANQPPSTRDFEEPNIRYEISQSGRAFLSKTDQQRRIEKRLNFGD